MCNRVFVGSRLVLLLQQLLWARESIYQAVLPEVLHTVSPLPPIEISWQIIAGDPWGPGQRST